jgi:putative tryptophan/tyrosine transport system substrate-binding protein
VIDRRSLLRGVAGSLLAAPPMVRAQPARKLHRIGMLGVGSAAADMSGPQPRSATANALVLGMRELGYVFGEDFVTEPRSPQGEVERFPALIAELIDLRVDVIVAAGPALAALKRATSTIPIVMAGAEDPVGLGVVKSLSHPGTNFTGLSNQSVEATVKKLELLKEIVPGPSPVAVLWDPESLLSWRAAEVEAQRRGWKLLSFEVRDLAGIEAAIRAASAARAGALLPAGGLVFRHARRTAELAAASRLPAFYSNRAQVGDAGLIAYGADLDVIWHRAAVFVDKILKGARPAELAVEQPTKFTLTINLKTAKALGITIPKSVLLRADEVIQ